jgi:hypothetical protein
MKENYYFVRTPLQYLNAVEARNNDKFKSGRHNLIVLSDFHRTLSQIESIIETEFWSSIIFPWKVFSAKKNNPIFNAINIIKRKRKIDKIILDIKPIDLIFWGNLNSNWFFYLYQKTKSNIYILDDGFVSINTILNKDLKAIKSILLSSKIGKIERFILKLSFSINWGRIFFFTNFDLKTSEKNIEFHNYEFLSKQLKLSTLKNTVYFIGQPLIFQKMMKNEVYVTLVDSIIRHYQSKDLNCFYIPHRSTTLDYIPNHWSTKSFNKPLECILFDESIEKPMIFVSFYSSALYNIAMMDKNSVFKYDYWQFDEIDLINFPFKTISDVYKFIRSQNKDNVNILHKSVANA